MNLRARLQGMDRRRQTLLLILTWLILLAVLWIWWDERTLPDIRGAWASASCEEIRSGEGVSHVKRTMRIEDVTWRLKIDFYGDADCAKGLFSLEIEGPYDIGPKSMDVRGATTARFDRRMLTLTARTAEAAAAFDAAGCGTGTWKVGEGQEIDRQGCLGLIPTIDACPVEYDIVKLDDDRLYLGDRSRGMCVTEKYPKAFAPTPLERSEPEI